MRTEPYTNKKSNKINIIKNNTVKYRKKIRKLNHNNNLIYVKPELKKIILPKSEYKYRVKMNKLRNKNRELNNEDKSKKG